MLTIPPEKTRAVRGALDDGTIYRTDRRREPQRLQRALAYVQSDRCAIVENVLDRDFIGRTRDALYGVQEKIRAAPVAERIIHLAGGLNVLRLTFLYDPFFFRFLELPEVLDVVDKTVSPTAVLHTQN